MLVDGMSFGILLALFFSGTLVRFFTRTLLLCFFACIFFSCFYTPLHSDKRPNDKLNLLFMAQHCD
jgi:hypothetical protein